MEVDEEEVKAVPVVEINDSMSELEDGELEDDSDDDPMTSRAIRFGTTSSMSNDVLNTSREVLNKRAERFGLNTARKLPENPDIRKLHISMGVNNKTRTEALHLYGTDNMTTQDVFQYFDEPPASVEWLSNQTCNAVWLDEESCAKALLRHSIKIRGQPDSFDSDSEDEEYVNASDLRLTLPPGGAWRKGQTKSYAPNLLIRFANVNDKKELRPYVPESLKMKEKLFADGGDETVKKITTDDSGNPWSGLAQQWGSFERQSRNKFGGIQDARQLIKEKELRGSLIKNDARDLIKYNRICRLEKEGLDPEILAEYKKDQERNKYKRSLRLDDGPNRKRSRRSPGRDENLQIIVENDAYKPAKRPSRTRPTRPPRSTSSSSDSSSSSSGDSSSSSSDDSSSSSSSSEDEEDEPPKPPPQPSSLKAPWNKSSNKFKADSSLLIEIDNDLCRKKRHNE